MQNYYFIPAPPNEIAEKRFLVDERPIFRRSASKTTHTSDGQLLTNKKIPGALFTLVHDPSFMIIPQQR